MSITSALLLFIFGLGLVLFFAEKLVKGVVETSVGFGFSAFLISVIFLGFDPDNLSVGAVGSYEEIAGIASGSIIGSAMVALAFVFGLTAVLAPMSFAPVPRQVLAVPVLAVALFWILVLDGRLSGEDGGLLLLAFAISILYLLWIGRKGLVVRPSGEVAEVLEKSTEASTSKWKSLALFIFSLAAIVAGSELLVISSKTLIRFFGISETTFGMTVLAFLVSIEELARELPAALKGRPEITFGNVLGSILAFFLFNAGIIGLINPVPINARVLQFYLPICFVTVAVMSLFMLTRSVSRWAGGVLIALYLFFVLGGSGLPRA